MWFVDHNYHEEMYAMYKKINIKEKFLGWYVTGSSYLEHDIEIQELFAKYHNHPVLIVVNVNDKTSQELPTKGYVSK